MKQTILTIIISVVTTFVALNLLSQESWEKLIDVAEEVLVVQIEGKSWSVASGSTCDCVLAPVTWAVATDVEIAQVETGSVVDTWSISTWETDTGIDYNPTEYNDEDDAYLFGK